MQATTIRKYAPAMTPEQTIERLKELRDAIPSSGLGRYSLYSRETGLFCAMGVAFNYFVGATPDELADLAKGMDDRFSYDIMRIELDNIIGRAVYLSGTNDLFDGTPAERAEVVRKYIDKLIENQEWVIANA